MKKSKRFQPITRLAEIKEQDAARLMGACKQKHKEQMEQLESLKEYRDSYVCRYQTASMAAHQLTDYRLFLDKLNRAIQEQESVILKSLNAVYDQEKLWQCAHQHTNGVQKLSDKAVRDERYQQEKRAQSELDERSGRGRREL
jgi:flagellar FliJ protein